MTNMKAEKGDLIRIVKEKRFESNTTEDLLLGAIYEVDHVDREGDVNFIDRKGDHRYLSDHTSYEIHRKAGGEDSEQDAVNSPNHYTQGKFETIEIIEEITKGYTDGYVAYCVGNALKYLARAPFKHGEPSEDLAKAGAYINFALKHVRGSE